MKLLRSFAVLSFLALASGCGDSTAPVVPQYTLTAVGGKGLPIVYQGIDTGSKLLWGTLTLDRSGHATVVNGYEDWGVIGGFTSSRYSVTLSGAYTVAGNSITVIHPTSSACNGQPCVLLPNQVGFFSDTLVTLATDLGPTKGPVYTYYTTH